MTPTEERAQLVAPMELIGKAMQQLQDLYRETNYAVYELAMRRLSEELTYLNNHDVFLRDKQ